MPNLQSNQEKQEYLEALFRREVPFPLIQGGMGVGISDVGLVNAMEDVGWLGTYAASAPGAEICAWPKPLPSSPEARSQLLDQANRDTVCRDLSEIRERHPHRIVAANIMEILLHYRSTREAILADPNRPDILVVGAGVPRELAERMAQPDCRDIKYVIIASSRVAVELVVRNAQKKGGRLPDGVYYENPLYAGGHLGLRRMAEMEQPELFDPETVIGQIRDVLPGKPVWYGGGVGYRDQIAYARTIADGVVEGIRPALTDASGIRNDVICDVYLNENIGVVTDESSPTHFPARRMDTPVTQRTQDYIRQAMQRCVGCVKRETCEFLKKAGDPDDIHYCIADELTRLRFGEPELHPPRGVFFTGSLTPTIRRDALYQRDDAPYVPTVQEMTDFMLTHDAPPDVQGLRAAQVSQESC